MDKVELIIDEIIDQSKGENWIFIKKKATIVEFDNKMKNLNVDSEVERFFVNDNDEYVVDEIIKWTKEQVDLSESPLYSRDSKVESLLVSSNQSAPKYWLIFFKQR